MPVTIENRRKLYSAIRDARIRTVIDTELVKNDAEAMLLTALLKTYGKSAAGFIYYSPGRARSSERPPDAVLCHPDVGVLVIDAKGHTIDAIERVEAGHIFVRYQGRIKPKNVIQQVEDQMFDIQSDARKLIRNNNEMPLMNAMVAFPNIRESEWSECGFDQAHPTRTLLFRDQMETKARLRQRITQIVKDSLSKTRKKNPLNVDHVDTLYKVFGNSSVINDKRSRRTWIDENSLGDYVDEMVSLDKYLSREQEELSRMLFEGSPRLIRGVAGSGKSVVLANLVARYLHRRLNSLEIPLFPEPISIAVTCYNRALVDFLRQKIRNAYREQTLNADIPSSVLQVKHLNGLLYYMINSLGWPLEYISPYEISHEEWARHYRDQIRQFSTSNPEHYHSTCFDAIFVDEGQDFEPDEFRLILDLVRTNEITGEKPIVIFYDDAQNIYGRSRPVWQDIGLNLTGQRSRVMRECFRNTRQIVELAFNVLLGSQASPNQRVQTRTYADINYLKERNVIEEAGDHIRVKFAEREYRPPEIKEFERRDEEIEWLSNKIVTLIKDEFVRPEDILVLFRSKEFDYNHLMKLIQEKLPEIGFVLPFGNSADKDHYIFQENKLTLSTVNGAKGYDAPLVFLVGVDLFDDTRRDRAAFYVGATRAKLLLFLTGTRRYQSLLREAQEVSKVL